METVETEPGISLAEEMARITCELAKTCTQKENYFASLFNLTPAEFKCLRLFTNKKILSIKEITYQLQITPGRITHILTSLESKKFITRKIDPTDKRNVMVNLTSKSEPFIRNLNETHIKLHEEILEKIDPEKREIIIDAMKEVIVALNLWSKQAHSLNNEVKHV
jgi:DNA-binding MarR family transcriptional regulator